MKCKILVGFLVLFGLCSCASQNTDIGLRIESGMYRGVGYTDKLGVDYNLRYMPVRIKNGEDVPIQLQIAFSREYEYPVADGYEQFKIIPLPEAWALEGTGVSEEMYDELPQYIDNPTVNVQLEPGEESLISIGALYSRPPRLAGVLPLELFVYDNAGKFPDCDWQMPENQSAINPRQIGVMLRLGEACILIPAGQITY